MLLHIPLDGKIKALHLVKRLNGSLQVTPLKTARQLSSMYFSCREQFAQESKKVTARLTSGYAVILLAGKKLNIPTRGEIGELLLSHSEDIEAAGCRITPKPKLPDIEDIVQQIAPSQIDTSCLFIPA